MKSTPQPIYNNFPPVSQKTNTPTLQQKMPLEQSHGTISCAKKKQSNNH